MFGGNPVAFSVALPATGDDLDILFTSRYPGEVTFTTRALSMTDGGVTETGNFHSSLTIKFASGAVTMPDNWAALRQAMDQGAWGWLYHNGYFNNQREDGTITFGTPQPPRCRCLLPAG